MVSSQEERQSGMRTWSAVAAAVAAAPFIAYAGISAWLLGRTPSVPLWYLLLAAPFWEEAFFRGVVQYYLMGRPLGHHLFLRLTGANWIASGCFVAVHLPFRGVSALGVLLPALVLGWLFERTGRVLPCIILHGWFNLSWLMAGRWMP